MRQATAPALAAKRIGLLTTSITHIGGGVAEAVLAQADIVRGLGGMPVIVALDDRGDSAAATRTEGTETRLVARRGPRLLGFAPRLLAELRAARLDCLHLHGIWQYPSYAAARWAGETGRPCVISPHGMLDPWITARGRWKKALARAGYERTTWHAAGLFHALTAREAADIARETGRSEIAVIPNAAPQFAGYPLSQRDPEVLYLGRIHPKKNIAALIAAWSRLAAQSRLPDGARLTIAGWGEPGDLARLDRDLSAAPPSVQFVGPSFGADKAARLARARFLVLPSLSEGLPMSVLEAWSAQTPVLMSAECNLPDGFVAGAALDCGMEIATLESTLVAALALSQAQWQAMSGAAGTLARGTFAAETVMQAWSDQYGRLLAAGCGPTR